MSNLVPFVRIYNSKNDLVLDGVTRFNYVFAEKADDASTITIETNDVNLPDHPDLQEGSRLLVTWGYLGGTSYQKRILYIWDTVVDFTAQGVRIDLTLFCKAAYLILNSSKEVHAEDNLKDLTQKIAKEAGLNFGTENLEPGEEAKSDYEVYQTGWTTQGSIDLERGGTTVARDNTSFVIKHAWKKYSEGVPQANKSDRKTLDELAALEPIDNLFIDGRDDDLIIKRRDFNQKPYKIYKFRSEPGVLLNFRPATRNIQAKKFSVVTSASAWSAEEKEFLQGGLTRANSGATVLGDMVNVSDEDKTRAETESIKKKTVEENYVPFDRRFNVDGLADLEFNSPGSDSTNTAYRKKIVQTLEGSKNPALLWHKRGTQAAKLNTKDHLFVSTAIDNTTVVTQGSIPLLNPKEYLPTVESNPTDMAGAAVNRQSQKEMELNEATATILGDPEAVNGKIYTFLGVSKKYSGHYYAHTVTHEITPTSGFQCIFGLYVTGFAKLGSEPSFQQDAQLLGLTKNLRPLEEGDNQKLVAIPTVTE